jgi:hypothetical protein
VNNLGTLAYNMDSLLEDSARMAPLKANVARPRAAFEVVERSLQWLPT